MRFTMLENVYCEKSLQENHRAVCRIQTIQTWALNWFIKIQIQIIFDIDFNKTGLQPVSRTCGTTPFEHWYSKILKCKSQLFDYNYMNANPWISEISGVEWGILFYQDFAWLLNKQSKELLLHCILSSTMFQSIKNNHLGKRSAMLFAHKECAYLFRWGWLNYTGWILLYLQVCNLLIRSTVTIL